MAARMGGSEAVVQFINEHLISSVTHLSAPPKVNIHTDFRRFLHTACGVPNGTADDCATKWLPQLISNIEEVLADWERLGIPRPLDWTTDQTTCVSWCHPKYEKVTGRQPLPKGYIEVYDWVRQRREREFLLVCGCMLKVLCANPIIITDGRGDCGIDLIGRLNDGPLRSTMCLVQSKTSAKPITREMIFIEYGKFLLLRGTEKFGEYRRALGMDQSPDGAAFCYMFLSNAEFTRSARQAGLELGILLRSCRQIALWLAKQTTRAVLDNLLRGCAEELTCDLDRNLCNRLAL